MPLHAFVLALLAQDQSTRPPFTFTRYAEDWSAFDGGDHWFDPLKHVDIADGVWISFGANARARYEQWSGFAFGPPPPADDSDGFLLTRVLAHGDLHLGDHDRVFLQLKTAQSTERTLPGGTRTLDVDSFDVQQAFYDHTFDEAFGSRITLRGGRQNFVFGKQRLVSPLPWGNTLRAWDGLTAIVQHGDWNFTGFWSEFAPVDIGDFNEPSSDDVFYGVYATNPKAAGDLGVDFYLLARHHDGVTFNGTAGDEDRYTVGARTFGKFGDLDLDVEIAGQRGDLGDENVNASMAAAELGLTPGAGPTRWFLGLDYASGDDEAGGDVGTFDQLYPLGHAYFGDADFVGRQNVIAAKLGATHKFSPKAKGTLTVNQFWLADDADALYTAGGGVLVPGGTSSSKEVGTEIDLSFRYTIDRNWWVDAGYAHVFGGSVLEDFGRTEDVDFFWIAVETAL
ncbi:MAG: alginate export family protein [Planctomycetota bacterium]